MQLVANMKRFIVCSFLVCIIASQVLAVGLDRLGEAFELGWFKVMLPKDAFPAVSDPVFMPLSVAVKQDELMFMQDSDWLIYLKYDKLARLSFLILKVKMDPKPLVFLECFIKATWLCTIIRLDHCRHSSLCRPIVA